MLVFVRLLHDVGSREGSASKAGTKTGQHRWAREQQKRGCAMRRLMCTTASVNM